MAKDTSLDDNLNNNTSTQDQIQKILEKNFIQGKDLTQEEINFIQDIQTQNRQVFEEAYSDFMQRDDVQKKLQEQQEQESKRLDELKKNIESLRYNQGLTEEGAYAKLRADSREQEFKSKGGKKILHFTDTEVEAKDLEGRLQKMLHDEGVLDYVIQNGTLPDDTMLVHTGDIGPDLFNQQKYRTQAFLADTLIKEGDLEGEQADEFKQLYHDLMDEAGITEEMLISGPKTQEDQQLLSQFVQMLYGLMDPQFKSKDEIKEFRKKRDKLHSHLEDAIINHAQRNMGEIKEVFDKYGLNSDNFVIIGGNHDVPAVVEETFKDSYMSEGETREVRGVKFNRPLGTATGSNYGPHLARGIMGSNELVEQIPQLRYNSQPIQELKEYVHSMGFNHLDEKGIDQLIKTSAMKARIGLPAGRLKDMNEEIEREVQQKIRQRLEQIPKTIDHNADVYIGHGDVTHPEHAGLEERYVSQLLEGKGAEGKFYLGGHQHGETTNRTNGMVYINPGASRDSYAHGAVFIDDKNKLQGLKRASITPNSQMDLMYRDPNEIASQSVQRTK